jgi:hypothetical protein
MPPKTLPKITPKCASGYKKRTGKTHGKTIWKMMPTACKRRPKGNPFLSVGTLFRVIWRLGTPPAALLPPKRAQIHKSVPKPLKNTAGTSKTHEKRTLKEHASGGPESSTALLLFWFLWPAAGPPNRLRTKMIKTLEMYIVVHFQMIFTSPRLSKYFPQHRQKRA